LGVFRTGKRGFQRSRPPLKLINNFEKFPKISPPLYVHVFVLAICEFQFNFINFNLVFCSFSSLSIFLLVHSVPFCSHLSTLFCVSSIATFFLNAEMCADIEIVTSNQYDGASAAHSELDRPAPRLRSALPRPHVRVDGTPPPPTEPGGSSGSGGGGLRGGSAFPPDLLLDGPPRTTRLPAHGVRGQAQRATGSVSTLYSTYHFYVTTQISLTNPNRTEKL